MIHNYRVQRAPMGTMPCWLWLVRGDDEATVNGTFEWQSVSRAEAAQVLRRWRRLGYTVKRTRMFSTAGGWSVTNRATGPGWRHRAWDDDHGSRSKYSRHAAACRRLQA